MNKDQPTHVYGVAENSRDERASIEKEAIVKMTEKQVKVSGRMKSYNYVGTLNKNQVHVCFSPNEAVAKYLAEKRKRLAHLEEEVSLVRKQMQWGRALHRNSNEPSKSS